MHCILCGGQSDVVDYGDFVFHCEFCDKFFTAREIEV